MHTCHALDCTAACPPARLFCLRHWNMLSVDLKNAIWALYRKGQERDKKPSAAYVIAQIEAIRDVAQKERSRTPMELDAYVRHRRELWTPKLTPRDIQELERLRVPYQDLVS
jgi:hypothetical protein